MSFVYVYRLLTSVLSTYLLPYCIVTSITPLAPHFVIWHQFSVVIDGVILKNFEIMISFDRYSQQTGTIIQYYQKRSNRIKRINNWTTLDVPRILNKTSWKQALAYCTRHRSRLKVILYLPIHKVIFLSE